MTEKRFFSFVITEGIILLILGLLIMTLPKITDITFGFILCLISLIYGGYKITVSIMIRKFETHYIINVLAGFLLFVSGLLPLVMPIIDISIITTMLGGFFIFRYISSISFYYQTKDLIPIEHICLLIPVIQMLFALILLIAMPNLWIAGMFLGIEFILTGTALINMYISKKYLQ